jgi:hypothetical protein
LADLHHRGADAQHVAQTDGFLGQAKRRNILAKARRRGHQILERRLFGDPIRIVIESILKDRLLGSAMNRLRPLLVTFETGLRDPDGPRDRPLADRADPAVRTEWRRPPGAYGKNGRFGQDGLPRNNAAKPARRPAKPLQTCNFRSLGRWVPSARPTRQWLRSQLDARRRFGYSLALRGAPG